MIPRAICATLILAMFAPFNPGFAQFRGGVPPSWPTLALNANKAPSCVFWTPPSSGTAGTPEYFCAVIVANTANDADSATICPAGGSCAQGALRAVRIDPRTGAVTLGAAGLASPSVILGEDPDNVTCTIIPPGFGWNVMTVQCLYGSVHRVGWDGTKWFSQAYPANCNPGSPPCDPTGVQGPAPTQPTKVTSNFNCVPQSGGTTCFAIETFYQGGQPNGSVIDQWTRDPTAVDWARPATNSQSSGLGMTLGPAPNRGPLACSATTNDKLACIVPDNGNLSELTATGASQSVAWATAGPTKFVTGGGVNTGQACVTVPSATSTPARTDCFFGDGGRIDVPPTTCSVARPCRWGLSWAPDDMSRKTEIAMLEPFPLKAQPSCLAWAAGQIECFFPDKALSTFPSTPDTNAAILHVLSFDLDFRAAQQQRWRALELGLEGIVINPGFWQESLGVAAPTREWGKIVLRGHTITAPVNNPKTLTSFACFKGPLFQSLCVAGLIDSKYAGVQTNPTPAQLDVYRASRRLVFRLVGNPNGVPPQQPTTTIVQPPPPVGGRGPRHSR